MEDGWSELVLKNFESVSSMEQRDWRVEMWDEEARILPICERTLVLECALEHGDCLCHSYITKGYD